jgi:hypothetical protein
MRHALLLAVLMLAGCGGSGGGSTSSSAPPPPPPHDPTFDRIAGAWTGKVYRSTGIYGSVFAVGQVVAFTVDDAGYLHGSDGRGGTLDVRLYETDPPRQFEGDRALAGGGTEHVMLYDDELAPPPIASLTIPGTSSAVWFTLTGPTG